MELSRRKLLSSLSPSLLSLSLPPACRARQLGLLSSAARRYRPTSSLRPGHSATARATTPALKPSTVGTHNPPPVSWTNSWSDRQPILRQNFQRQFRPAPFWCRRALHAVRGRTWDFLLKTSPNIKLQQPMHKLIIA